jgi:hypothetical protein
VSDDSFVKSATLMGTVVRIEVVGANDDETQRDERTARSRRCFRLVSPGRSVPLASIPRAR